MVSETPPVSAGWLSFFSPSAPPPITNSSVAIAIKDGRHLNPAIFFASTSLMFDYAYLERSNYSNTTRNLLRDTHKDMATEVQEYRRQRSRSPVYRGYNSRSKSRSPERRSRGDGLLPTPASRYEPSRRRSRSRSRERTERYNGWECSVESTLQILSL